MFPKARAKNTEIKNHILNYLNLELVTKQSKFSHNQGRGIELKEKKAEVGHNSCILHEHGVR